MRGYREFVEAHISNAGGDTDKGQEMAAETWRELMGLEWVTDEATGEDKLHFDKSKQELKAESVSIKEMAIGCARAAGFNYTLSEMVRNYSKWREAVGTGAFPQMIKYTIASVAIPGYQSGLNGADELITNMGKPPGGDFPCKVTGIIDDYKPNRVLENKPYEEGKMEEDYVQIPGCTMGKIVSLSKRVLLADDTGRIVRAARAASFRLGEDKHRKVVRTMTDSAVADWDMAAANHFWYNGSKSAVFLDSGHADGQTNDNTQSAALGFAGLTSLFTLAGTITDKDGEYVGSDIKKLIVPESRRVAAEQIVGGDWEYASANKNINPARFKALTVWSSPVIDQLNAAAENSANAHTWYAGDPAQSLWWYELWGEEFDEETADSAAAFERDVLLRVKNSFCGGCGYVDYRNIFRSTNA